MALHNVPPLVPLEDSAALSGGVDPFARRGDVGEVVGEPGDADAGTTAGWVGGARLAGLNDGPVALAPAVVLHVPEYRQVVQR